MTENTHSKILVKEIQIEKGYFSIKSKSGKLSASESYKEQLLSNQLPLNAPKEFKDAIPDLYYAPKDSNLVKYNDLHGKINFEKEEHLKEINNPSDEDKKKALIEISKKILKEYGINDRTYIVYSPQITKKLEENDEFYKVGVTFNLEEKVLYVRTELLPRDKKNIPQELFADDFVIDFNILNATKMTENIKTENVIENSVTATKVINVTSNNVEKDEELAKKINIEEIKKKYNFKRPEVQSISDILKKNNPQEKVIEKVNPNKDKEDSLKQVIKDSLGNYKGEWKNNSFIINKKESGYLLPIEKIELDGSKLKICSSLLTNTEMWTKFTPIHQCPRFEGALYIPDEYATYCQDAKCNTACGAEDGFVELSAGRFRLIQESEIIKNQYKRLQQFLDRCYSMMDEFQSIFGVEIKLDINTHKPFFYSEFYSPFNENVITNYIEAYKTLYPEITDIRGKIDIDSFYLDEDYDPVSENGLIQEAKVYNLQEMVKLGAEDILKDTIKNKDGSIEGNFFLIDNGRLRYLLKNHTIEAYRDELYMGNVSFKKGLNEIHSFVSTILGGGRW